MTKAYIVVNMVGDATRPWAVVRTFRNFNKVVQKYETRTQANKRASAKNKQYNSGRHGVFQPGISY